MYKPDSFISAEIGPFYNAARLYIGQVCSIYGIPSTRPMTETLCCMLKAAQCEDKKRPVVYVNEELKSAAVSRTLLSHRTIEQYINKFAASGVLAKSGSGYYTFCACIEPLAKRKNWNDIEELKVICKRNEVGDLNYQCEVCFRKSLEWESDPATEKQKWVLKKFGIYYDENITKGEAASLIDKQTGGKSKKRAVYINNDSDNMENMEDKNER